MISNIKYKLKKKITDSVPICEMQQMQLTRKCPFVSLTIYVTGSNLAARGAEKTSFPNSYFGGGEEEECKYLLG